MQLPLTIISWLLYQEAQDDFLSSMTTMEVFQVSEYQKSLPETVMSLQITPPSMMVKSDIIVTLISIAMPIPNKLPRTFRLHH